MNNAMHLTLHLQNLIAYQLVTKTNIKNFYQKQMERHFTELYKLIVGCALQSILARYT